MENKQVGQLIPKGVLLIIGGAENKGEDKANEKETPSDFERLQILRSFLELTGKENPRVEVVTSGTSEPEETFVEYKDVFAKLKATNIGQIYHKTRKDVIDDKDLLKKVKNADAIFLSGGDQLRYTYLYGGSKFLTELKLRYINDGIVIAGTSAGAMAMSTPMIYAGSSEVQEMGGRIKVTTGLELVKDVCIDTHFVKRGRFIRMAQVIVTNPTVIGLGIEEDTAVIIRNGKDVQVIGTGTVIVMDGMHITHANIDDFTSDKPINIHNLEMHILCDHCTYDIPRVNPPHL